MVSFLAAALMAVAPVTNANYYSISDNMSGQHGKVTYVCDNVQDGKYLAGSTVTLTINPNIFYEITEKPTANVELTQNQKNDKVYTFTMPEYDVNISYNITLNHYIDDLKSNQYVGFIVTWVIDSGFLLALIIVFAKYRKYKAMTTEELNKVIETKAIAKITEAVQKLDKEEIAKLTECIGDINAELDVLQKCFILAQDRSPQGRAALMNYLDTNVKSKSKTEEDNKEVKEAIEEQKVQADKDIKTEEEVLEKVEDDYEPIE